VPTEVVTKRSQTSGGAGDSAARTRYYVTFQVESGDRIELPMNGQEYGLLAVRAQKKGDIKRIGHIVSNPFV